MSKKALIILVAIIAVGALLYFKGMKKDEMKDDETGGNGTGAITYACDGGKSFTLTSVDKDTIRVSGPGVTAATLEETSQGTGYWANADGKTTVKTVGSYVILVQNDLTTHDKCQEVK